MSAQPGVLVAGGGIGGLALAIGLRRRGLPVTVIERTTQARDAGSGLVLYPNAVHALRTVDESLAAAVLAAGHVPQDDESRPVLATSGEVLSTDRVGELAPRFGAPQVSLLRTTLRSLLAEFAERAGVAVRTGLRVLDHVDTGHWVEVALSDGSSATGTALIGADGLHSVVRERLLGPTPTRYCGYTTLRGRSPAPAAFPHGFIVTAAGLGLFAAPIGGGRLYWTAKVRAEPDVWPAKESQQALADLHTLIGGWHRDIVAVVRDSDPAAPAVVTDINDREPVSDWGSGRVTLLGDAAHPMSPGAGQGAGMALEDAAVLSGVLAREPDIPIALRAYAAARAPRTAAIVRLSRQRDHVVRGEHEEFSTHDTELTDLLSWRADHSVAIH
jgi:salicylate hydroxylase